MYTTLSAILLISPLVATAPDIPPQIPGGAQQESTIQSGQGGGFLNQSEGPCVSDEDRDQIMASMPKPPPSGANRSTRLYSFYPMGGKLWDDVFLVNFVDLDPSSSQILDWDCTDYTYDGHDASDASIRTFEEQTIGVPVFSALDGTVIAAHDGEPDRNTSWQGQPANYVAIDHGGGQVCYYYHFKKDSVAVAVGENVVAGQQIGQIGSSGNSSGPHLHFATYDNGQLVEPWAGSCNSAASLWRDQIAIDRETRVMDFAVSDVRPDVNGGMPHEMPRSGYVELNKPAYLWYTLTNLPAFSNWQMDYVNPSGTVVFSSGPHANNNSSDWRGTWWWYWYHGGQFNNTIGQWKIRFYINGALELEAPYEVVASSSSKLNRAPEPVTIELGPIDPPSEGVFKCEAQSTSVLDDADFDVLHLQYVWQINGTIVRDVTTAALSDVIPSAWATAGDQVQCSVSVGDGSTSLASVADGLVVATPQMRISIPDPVELGATNRVHLQGGQPSVEAMLVFGQNPGWSNIPGCPGLGVDIKNATLAATTTTDINGATDFDIVVPAAAQGHLFIIQALSRTVCEKSNLLFYQF